jgi:hypothetical protein
MTEKKPRDYSFLNSGVFQDIGTRIKLIVRLIGDSRINPFLKILPIGALIYLFLPDLFIGPIDDAFLLWLGTTLFVDLCPQVIVQEHLINIRSGMPNSIRGEPKDEVVIDAEVRDLDDPQ